jgi:hypothetical protein
LLEATLFGLPMLGVDMPAGRGALPEPAGAINPGFWSLRVPPQRWASKPTILGVAPSLTARYANAYDLHGGPSYQYAPG